MARIEPSWCALAEGGLAESGNGTDPTLGEAVAQGEPAVLRLADRAVALWHAAVEIDDAALLDDLRPLMMRVGRILAQDAVRAEASLQ